MKKYLILFILIFLVLTVQSQEKEINKEAIESSGALINFLMKYDKDIGKEVVDQNDFNKMLKGMNWSNSEISNKALTKEDAFKFVNTYIKADKGEAIEIDTNKKGEVVNFLNEIEKGKKEALAIFNEATTDVKLNQMMVKAEKELYDAGMFRKDVWYSYKEYKAIVQRDYPKATEGQIKIAYKYFLKQIKEGMGIKN